MKVIGATTPFEVETYEEMVKYSTIYKEYNNNIIVEIGSSDNSYYLNKPLCDLYSGLLIDGSQSKINTYNLPNFKPICRMITPDNICSILEENNIPKDFYMLNLDIDGLDFFVLLSILKQYKPKLIITEYNEKIPYPFKYSIKPDPNFTWGWCHNYGYSVACIKDIMINFGYKIDSLNVNNIYLSRIDDNTLPNIEDVQKFYKSGYLDKKEWLDNNYQPWNKDVSHFHLCKTQEEFSEALYNYFINNKNANTGQSMINEVNKYIINDDYEEEFKKLIK